MLPETEYSSMDKPPVGSLVAVINSVGGGKGRLSQSTQQSATFHKHANDNNEAAIKSGSTTLLAPPLSKDRRLTDVIKKRSKFVSDKTTTNRSSVGAGTTNTANPIVMMNLK